MLEALRYNFGPVVTGALDDENIMEIMLNDDGNLWLDEFGNGMVHAGEMQIAQATTSLKLIASLLGRILDQNSPILEGELPLDGSRFEGFFPPVVPNPSFSIRKKASKIFTLQEYVEARIMTPEVSAYLSQAIDARKNILVVGGTGSGKTTLTNAVLAELAAICPDDRLVLIEDTGELQNSSRNKLSLHTTQTITMRDLLKATMRARPDRIIVGEVRDGAALDLLKAWNTGHPGGICTVHANDAYSGLVRLEQLISEVSVSPMPTLIKEAINVVVYIERRRKDQGGRKVTEVAQVNKSEGSGYQLEYIYKRAA